MIWPPQDTGKFEVPPCAVCRFTSFEVAEGDGFDSCAEPSIGSYIQPPQDLKTARDLSIGSYCERYLDPLDGETEILYTYWMRFRFIKRGMMASHEYDLSLPMYLNGVYVADVTDSVTTDSDGTLTWELTLPSPGDPGVGNLVRDENTVFIDELVIQ